MNDIESHEMIKFLLGCGLLLSFASCAPSDKEVKDVEKVAEDSIEVVRDVVQQQ
jgi:hypothetical protein